MNKKITILGWKREYEHIQPLLNMCEKLSYELSKMNYAIVTGGGDGFMKAANKGAFANNKLSSYAYSMAGLGEGESNIYTLPSNHYYCENFTTRKSILCGSTDCLIYFPGGIGTLDEFMDTINLYKTNMRQPKPIILVGTSYWLSLKKWFEDNKQDWPSKFITLISDDMDEILIKVRSELN